MLGSLKCYTSDQSPSDHLGALQVSPLGTCQCSYFKEIALIKAFIIKYFIHCIISFFN